MTVTDCPECGYAVARATGKGTVDGEAAHFFECGECGHEWAEPIL